MFSFEVSIKKEQNKNFQVEKKSLTKSTADKFMLNVGNKKSSNVVNSVNEYFSTIVGKQKQH